MTCGQNTSQKLTIAACGDSITAGSYGSYLPALRICLQNAGYRVEIDSYARPGHNSREYLRFLKNEGLAEKKYDYLLIMLGSNDVRIDGDYQSGACFGKNIELIVSLLAGRYPEAKIVLITPPPFFKIDLPTFNEHSRQRLKSEIVPVLKAISLKKKTRFVDLQQELAGKNYLFSGIHPNQSGFRAIGRIVARFIGKDLKMSRGK